MNKKILSAVIVALAVLGTLACGRRDGRLWGNVVVESIACERAPSFEYLLDTVSASDDNYEIARLTIRFRWADKAKGFVLERPEICLRDEQGWHYLMNSSRIEYSLPKETRTGPIADKDTLTLFFAVRKKMKLTSLEWRDLSLGIPL